MPMLLPGRLLQIREGLTLGVSEIGCPPVLRNQVEERRIRCGETNSMGEFSHQSQGKSEKGKKADLDGLL